MFHIIREIKRLSQMIFEQQNQIKDLYRLISEKHEMIIESEKKINDLYRLMSEKHEMIMADRGDISLLVRAAILQYYNERQYDKEVSDVLAFLRSNTLQMIPYEFTKNYYNRHIDVFYDDDSFPYVIHNKKKLFFPAEYTPELVNYYYTHLIAEQDINSPHLYFDKKFNLHDKEMDEFIDVGAAEGIIALDNIDEVRHMYLIEADDKWIPALERTFSPYGKKVTILHGYAGNQQSDISISNLFDTTKKCCLKIDVEGAEMRVLDSIDFSKISANSMIACCLYHHQYDEEVIKSFFEGHNYNNYSVSSGYILSDWGGYSEPYLRRGIIRVTL